MRLGDSVTSLRGVGADVVKKLRKLGIESVNDLLHHYPRRYEDYSRIVPIKDASPGLITVKGEITHITSHRSRQGRNITKALIDDGTGGLQAVWFNQPYLSKSLPKNTPVYVSGELKFAYSSYALQSPSVERVSAFPGNAARIVPIYPETEGVSSKQLRGYIKQIFPVKVPDPLPDKIHSNYDLLTKNEALSQIHFPDSTELADRARHRLGFEELYILLLALADIKSDHQKSPAPKIEFDQATVQELVGNLPFELTESQRKCAWKIIQDMQQDRPMNRLLQGDVGSGKTVVAAIAAAVATRSGFQTAILAPTSVLAEQHYETIRGILEPLNTGVVLLTGATKGTKRQEVLKSIKTGEAGVCIGTHALLEDDVEFRNLGLAVVDEQHRFGVKQRNKLHAKAGLTPHLLSMSATPIPRSLALTVYGDMDVSLLRDMPAGRKDVITRVATNDRQVYDQLRQLIDKGSQVYVVCPLITESDTLGVKSVEQEIRMLHQKMPGVRIEGLNGRMTPKEKKAIMKRFHGGEIDILVSTTVVEVGVDVANAAAIVIEGAERFGLATLHQLRGRVGRSDKQAYCFLKPSSHQLGKKRLQLLEKYNDGLVLAEKDLQLRGAGEIYGEQQHGMLDMRLVRLTDTELIAKVQQAVSETTDSDISSDLRKLVEKRKSQKHLN